MYLEKLEIHGFKSFAHKNKLVFPGLVNNKRGLTSIVGPNGSGKSNIADAVRWALGEQSLKTLRGKKSEDVIFSGSDSKNQLSLAEVSLYLNNEDKIKQKGSATKDAKDDKEKNDLDQLLATASKIVITRRLYRNGESEYLLNNNRVRLSSIQMLLAKANFGQKTYSVIGQGMVENFLTTSATERKNFFDEATGVKQFQIKRDSALNKLEASYRNLQQVDMLLSEIKPRLKSLTRQVEKLKRRDEIAEKLHKEQLDYYAYLWQNINQKLDSFNQRFLEQENIKRKQEKKLNSLNEKLNNIRTKDNFHEITAIQPQLKNLENQRNQTLKQLTKLQIELENQLEAQGQFDISWLNNKQSELNASLESLNLEIKALDSAHEDQKKEKLEQALEKNRQEIEKIRKKEKEVNILKEEKNKLLRQDSKLEAILEANLEVQGQFDISWLNNKQNELKLELEEVIEEIKNKEKESIPKTKDRLKQQLQVLQEKLETRQQEIKTINDKLKENNKDKNSAEIDKAVKKFLSDLDIIEKEQDIKKIKIKITIAKKEFSEKIEMLLKGIDSANLSTIRRLQSEIIDITEERQQLNTQLNKESFRLFTAQEKLRLLEKNKQQLEQSLNDVRSKLIKAQTKFDDSKIKNEQEEIRKKIKNINHQINELNQENKLSELEELQRSILDKLQNLRIKLSAKFEHKQLLEKQVQQNKKEIDDIEYKISKSKIKFDSSEIEREKEKLEQIIININSEIKTLENQLKELNDAQEKEKEDMFLCQTNIQNVQRELNETSDKIYNWRLESTRLETRLEDLENSIKNDEISLTDIRNHSININDINNNELIKNINRHKTQLEQIGGIDPEAEKEYLETKERHDFLSKQTDDLNDAIKSLEKIVYELDINIKNRFESEFKLISKKFNEYFKVLFNGGSAKIFKINLDNSDNKNSNKEETINTNRSEEGNIVNDKLRRIKQLRKNNALGLAGIEIKASPPGKRIQTVTMLSGGERALTAIALISAIISANPSPFVVLDEADAALDEANSERLAQILDDLSNKTQFIVITHNRACMRKSSVLYGVTMEKDGISKLLSVKLDKVDSIISS